MSQYFETHRDNLIISTDPARLDMDAICDFLSRSYWAKGRPRAATERGYANSLVFGLYDGPRQIGMARVVSDISIFAYLMDVFVHEDYRGHGVGTWFLETVFNCPELKNVRRWMLATDDAHGFYARFGFKLIEDTTKWMEWIRPFTEESA